VIALERAITLGSGVKQARVRALAEELSGHLRALLSDVICGHLDSDLIALADELLIAEAAPEEGGDAGEGDNDELEEPADEAEGEGAKTAAAAS
jgi:hypothetical protein